ncbi:MAG: hypothetical protein UX72_C0003G0019 [Parcubacteria group bacterium GW2011_GWA2_47_10]|nr:MAG: hypothetical protein UX72_C0003G0019 [Parcubacteria group bacterium GW2011_GWA2_47_10]
MALNTCWRCPMRQKFLFLTGLFSILGMLFSLAYLSAVPARTEDKSVEGKIFEISSSLDVKIVSRQYGFIFSTNLDRFPAKAVVEIGDCVLLTGREFSYRLGKSSFIPQGGQLINQVCKAA